MGGVSAVDHVVRRRAAGRAIDLVDGLGQRRAVWQAPVGLDSERRDARHACVSRGQREPGGLVDIAECQSGHLVHARRGQRHDLVAVIVPGLQRIHQRSERVCVAPRTHAAADHHGLGPVLQLELIAQGQQHDDGIPVGRVQLVTVVAEDAAPVRVRPPGHALEDEPGTSPSGH